MTERPKRAVVLEHARHEDVAGLRAPIEAAGYRVETVHVPTTALGDEVAAADLLVVMGGPMGVYQREAYPWIVDEIDALRHRIGQRAPTLGVCLGSQLIAAALGSAVYPGPSKEVGFAPVTLTPAGTASPLRHLAGVPVLHWHGDTFDLPGDAELLASSAMYRNQAFRIGGHLLALQCHPEMGLSHMFETWLAGSDGYVAEAGTTVAEVRADYARLGPAAVAAGQAVIAEWLAQFAT